MKAACDISFRQSRAATCVLMKDAHTPDVLDASMIADAQAVEHYEIAAMGPSLLGQDSSG